LEGNKEVLDYALYPSESASNYKEMLQSLKNRGLEQVLLSSFFVFYEFPDGIRRSIYTTNLIENLNENLKCGTKRKEQFPNEDSLERYVCSFYCDYNQSMDRCVHKGFKEYRPDLEAMFL
jgi:transposase, mutator family